jgi:DNA polymerase I-like protein with 3'-5' exonuclease and polymerase domains
MKKSAMPEVKFKKSLSPLGTDAQIIDVLRQENAYLRDKVDELREMGDERDARIAELERQLNQRTGRVHSANQQIDAVLQTPQYDRMWA